jgi:hypothetical protein
VQAPPQRLLLRCAAAGALSATAAAAAAAEGPRPPAQAEGSDSSSDLNARVAHVYRIEGLGTLTLEGALPGAKLLYSCYLVN